MIRRIYPTRFGQLHLRSHDGRGVPLVLLHMSPRSGAMWEAFQEKLERPTHAPDRLGYGYSDAPPWALSLEQYAQALWMASKPPECRARSTCSASTWVPSKRLKSRISWVPRCGAWWRWACRFLRRRSSNASWRNTASSLCGPQPRAATCSAPGEAGSAFREPPYDLSDAHNRFVEHVLAANPGAAFRAACGYAVDKKLKSLKTPLTVFAPHDDTIEQTLRVKALLKPSATFVELPDLGLDIFHSATDRMTALVNRHLPAN